MPNLLRIKPMSMLTEEAAEQGEHTLKRSLGALNLVTLGIGAVIGAGIFTLTGQAAALRAGPAVALSFVVAGLTCAFAGLCYAEFASIIPIAGSAYTYGYATLGELAGPRLQRDVVEARAACDLVQRRVHLRPGVVRQREHLDPPAVGRVVL